MFVCSGTGDCSPNILLSPSSYASSYPGWRPLVSFSIKLKTTLISCGYLRYKLHLSLIWTMKAGCPQDSDYLRDHEWLWEHFPPDIRFHSVIVTADNVLTPDTLKLVNMHCSLHIYQGSAHFHSSFFTSTNLLRQQGARTDSSGTMSVTGGFKRIWK